MYVGMSYVVATGTKVLGWDGMGWNGMDGAIGCSSTRPPQL